MTDSRITVAVGEVAAAIELLTNARNTMHDLLEEDPAFTGGVRLGVLAATRELIRADRTVTNALSALRTADACVNRVGA